MKLNILYVICIYLYRTNSYLYLYGFVCIFRLPTLAIVGIVGVNVFIIVVSVLVITFIKRRNSGSSAFGYVIQQNVV